MKKIILAFIILSISFTCFAQTTAWKELDAFHKLVSKVLHPVMMGDIKPVKDSSAVLLAKAKEWQSSETPAGIDPAKVKIGLDELVKECTALDDAVKNKSTAKVLKPLAVKVHNTFHSILSAADIKD